MIAEEIIEKLEERLVERIRSANLFVIKKIAKKIKQIGMMTPSSANDVLQVMEYGGDLEEIVKELAKETALNVKDIYEIFEEVGKNDQRFAKKYFEYKKKRYIPWEENETLRNEVKAIADITANKYANISNTRGIGYTIKEMVYDKATGQYKEKVVFKKIDELYKKVVDEGIISISEGKTTFDEEIGKLIKQIGRSGLKYIDYESGYSRRLDSALRMNLSDGLGMLHNQLQKKLGKQFGADGVEISVHMHPAPDHEYVQGRQFSISKYDEKGNEIEKGEFEKFQDDEDAVSYDGMEFPAEFEGRDRRSISEYNCKHYVFSIALGVKPEYTNEQLQKIIDDNEKGFEYKGKKYTVYEGTQLQRKIETEIRKEKDIQIMSVESGNKELAIESQERIDKLVSDYYELSNTSGLPTYLDRIKVEGYKELKDV